MVLIKVSKMLCYMLCTTDKSRYTYVTIAYTLSVDNEVDHTNHIDKDHFKLYTI